MCKLVLTKSQPGLTDAGQTVGKISWLALLNTERNHWGSARHLQLQPRMTGDKKTAYLRHSRGQGQGCQTVYRVSPSPLELWPTH